MAILKFNPTAMKTWRQLRGLNQKDLAERCGLSRPFISQIEKGNRVPSAPAAEDIAKSLGVDLSRLYEYEPQGDKNAVSAPCPHCGGPIYWV